MSLEGDRAIRHLHEQLEPAHFLHCDAALQLVERGQLLPWQPLDMHTLVSPRLPFVAQPAEWCDAQFDDAARLTLDLAEQALLEGWELKDASAWNVLFDGARPVFCDHLSFQLASSRLWWAAGQFARHFIVPLWLSRACGLPARCSMQTWRDGVPPATARRLLGTGRFMSRCWPLVAEGRQAPGVPPAADSAFDTEARRFRERLYTSLRWMLDGVAPLEPARSIWSGYVAERPQYPGDSLGRKRAAVGGWLQRLAPRQVLDLGCNTGEFSELALEAGARVVAIDADQQCIERLYRRRRGQPGLLPLVAALDDLPGGRGWDGREHPGLPQRLEAAGFDPVLALALIHHLAIASSIPMQEVATAARRWTTRWLVLECPLEDDPQLQLLCRQHRRDPRDFGLEACRHAFAGQGWREAELLDLAPAARSLLLLERGA